MFVLKYVVAPTLEGKHVSELGLLSYTTYVTDYANPTLVLKYYFYEIHGDAFFI